MSVPAIILASIVGVFNLLIMSWLISEWRRDGHLRYLYMEDNGRGKFNFSSFNDEYNIEQLLFWLLGAVFCFALWYAVGWILIYL